MASTILGQGHQRMMGGSHNGMLDEAHGMDHLNAAIKMCEGGKCSPAQHREMAKMMKQARIAFLQEEMKEKD